MPENAIAQTGHDSVA